MSEKTIKIDATGKDVLDIAPEAARYLFEHGGTIIITDVPKGTDFGIDLKSWNTGENFKGMKMIPPGLHFIHYSAVNEFGELSPRVGFFHIFKEKELLVKKWNSISEDLDVQEIDEEIVNRFRENLKDLDKFLGPYPFEMLKPWKDLTSKIDDHLMERCQPLCGYVRSALELVHCDDASRPRGPVVRKRRPVMTLEEKEDLLLPDMKPLPGTELRLTGLPDKYYPDDATPMEITQHSLDSSFALNLLLKKLREPMEIIGELQLSFVCFLVGQSWDAFEHWKKLISLICRADKIIPERRGIYVEFLRTLGQSALEARDMICSTWGQSAISYSTCKKWYHKFRKGDFNLSDGDCREVPVKVVDQELEDAIAEDPTQTLKELARRLKTTQTAVQVRMKKLGIGTKKGRWVKHEEKIHKTVIRDMKPKKNA